MTTYKVQLKNSYPGGGILIALMEGNAYEFQQHLIDIASNICQPLELNGIHITTQYFPLSNLPALPFLRSVPEIGTGQTFSSLLLKAILLQNSDISISVEDREEIQHHLEEHLTRWKTRANDRSQSNSSCSAHDQEIFLRNSKSYDTQARIIEEYMAGASNISTHRPTHLSAL